MKKLKEKKNKKHYSEVRLRIFDLTQKLSSSLLLIFIFLLPTQFGKHFFPSFSYLNGIRVDYLSPTLYLTDIIVFFLFVFNFKTIINFLISKKLFIFFSFMAANVFFAENQPVALYQYAKIIEFVVVFFLGKILFGKVSEKAVLATVFLSGTFQLILSLVQLILKHSLQGIVYFFGERLFSLSTPGIAKAALGGLEILRPYGTFSHPNSLAGFFLLLYFFVLVYKNFDKYTVLKYLSLLVFTILIFISFSKTAILTFLILNSLYFIFNSQIKCLICKIARILIPIFVSLIFLFAITDPLTIDKRVDLIKNAFSIIVDNPIFGVGLGNYLVVQSQFNSRYLLFFNQPVHNIFLLFMAETGILIFTILLKWLLSIKIIKEGMFIVFAVVLTGIFDHYWMTLQQNRLLLAFIYGAVSNSFFIFKLRSRS